MAQPMLAHRGPEFSAIYTRVATGLQRVFRSSRPVYCVTASATALMEMAIRGAPEGPILALVNGAFAERFARIAQRCGRRTRLLTVPWGETHPLELVEEHLAAEPYAAMTLVHSETSTGVLCDVRALTELAHRYGVMCLVDAVTSVAATQLETDAWGVDFVLTGSQKALAMPPGLGFAVASEAYILQASVAPERGRYLDPVEYEEASLRGGPPTTPAIPLFFAADAQVQSILSEGIEARWARHTLMREMVETWVLEQRDRDVPLVMQARIGERSPSISCLVLPPDRTAHEVVSALQERGYTIGRGYGKLQDSTVRIGHMGDHTPTGLESCLGALAEVLATKPRA
jgi:aspartate aminotransferase-like enzyme